MFHIIISAGSLIDHAIYINPLNCSTNGELLRQVSYHKQSSMVNRSFSLKYVKRIALSSATPNTQANYNNINNNKNKSRSNLMKAGAAGRVKAKSDDNGVDERMTDEREGSITNLSN